MQSGHETEKACGICSVECGTVSISTLCIAMTTLEHVLQPCECLTVHEDAYL